MSTFLQNAVNSYKSSQDATLKMTHLVFAMNASNYWWNDWLYLDLLPPSLQTPFFCLATYKNPQWTQLNKKGFKKLITNWLTKPHDRETPQSCLNEYLIMIRSNGEFRRSDHRLTYLELWIFSAPNSPTFQNNACALSPTEYWYKFVASLGA